MFELKILPNLGFFGRHNTPIYMKFAGEPRRASTGYSALFRHASFRQRLFGYTRQMVTLDATKTVTANTSN